MEDIIAVDRVYAVVCRAMEEIGQECARNDERRMLEAVMPGDPFPVKLRIAVRETTDTLGFFSEYPFRVPEKNAEFFAKKLAQLVYDNLYLGTFDFNPTTGQVVFRTEIMFRDSLISAETVLKLRKYVYETVTGYGEKLFWLSRGEE